MTTFLSCKECIHLLLDYVDGSVTPEIHQELYEHLTTCPPCQKYLNSYRTCSDMVLQLRNQQAQVPTELQNRLKSFLKEQVESTKV